MDSLPVEFYKVFWNTVKQLFLNAVNIAHKKGQLSLTQMQGTLTLLPTKGNDYIAIEKLANITIKFLLQAHSKMHIRRKFTLNVKPKQV